MAKIIYGVSGEGSGHAMRSREIIRFLKSAGHQVYIVGYDRSVAILKPESDFLEVAGFNITYRYNSVMRLQTVWRNAWRTPEIMRSYFELTSLVEKWKPNIIITDFEPLTSQVAIRHNLPLLSIDNIHQLTLDKNIPWDYQDDWLIAPAIIKLIVPRADWRIISVFRPQKKSWQAMTEIAPIIRPVILGAQPSSGSNIVVYDSFANQPLPRLLKKTPFNYVIYGFPHEGRDGNLTYRNFSEKNFLNDLLKSRAVIGSGGFTLLSECLVLGKPYLAFPVAHQAEQIENGLELERIGFGKMSLNPTAQTIIDFMTNLSQFRPCLRQYKHPGNE